MRLYWIIGRRLMRLVALAALLLLGYLAYASVQAAREFGFRALDWNQDGHVSPFEVLEAPDVLQQRVFYGERTCTRYVSLKDGRMLYEACPSDQNDSSD